MKIEKEFEEELKMKNQEIRELEAALEYAARRQASRDNRWSFEIILARYKEEGKRRVGGK